MTRTSRTSSSGKTHTDSSDNSGSPKTNKDDKNTPEADQSKRTDGKTNGGKKGDKDVNDGEGKGVDVSPGSTPPKAGTHERDVYDAKLRLVEEGKAAGMQAKQLLNSTLAEIKAWAKAHEDDGSV